MFVAIGVDSEYDFRFELSLNYLSVVVFRVVFVGFAASDDEHMPRNGVIKTISSHNDLVVFGVHRIDDVFEFEACSVDVSMPQPLDRPQGDQYFTVVRRIRLTIVSFASSGIVTVVAVVLIGIL